MATTEFVCPNIKCGGCAEAVTEALKALAGVQDVKVDIAAKAVVVAADDLRVTRGEMVSALTSAGFPPQQ
jgi:copper chaperone